MPAYDVPFGERPVDANTAKLAVALRELRRQLRWARWIPWRRRRRPQLPAEIDELTRQRQRVHGRVPGTARRL